jgi:3-dehydroquinate synthase
MQRFRVKSAHRDYPVVIGCGAWRALRELPLARYSSLFVLTERVLWKRWGERFLDHSGLDGLRVVFVPGGERSKSLAELERVASALLRGGADRRSLLILFGGGVVGDLGGFVASTFMRGIDCVQVPTTVVAQVDSSVGGKTAVNVGAAKNLVGTFYPPRAVLADPVVLSSLEERVFRSGLYEVVKHAILAGPPLFDELERRIGGLRPDSAPSLERLIAAAVKVKIDVVSRDEREAGGRRVLNLGHTVGHALEAATGYRYFLHGEAVGWGLLAVTRLASRLGWLGGPGGSGQSDGERMARLVERVGPLPPIRHLKPDAVLRLLPRDKKAVGGQVHWVIPERIGKVRIVPDVDRAVVAAVFRELQTR